MNSILVNLAQMTNATKALIVALVNAVFGVMDAFGEVLTDAQRGSIVLLVNALLALWVGLTYTNSARRLPPDHFAVPCPPNANPAIVTANISAAAEGTTAMPVAPIVVTGTTGTTTGGHP